MKLYKKIKLKNVLIYARFVPTSKDLSLLDDFKLFIPIVDLWKQLKMN